MSSATAPLLLLLDAGGTHTRALVASADGLILGAAEAGAGNGAAVGWPAARAAWREAARGSVRAAGARPSDIAAAAAGAAGVGRDGAGARLLARDLKALLPRARVLAASDVVLAWHGALGVVAGANLGGTLPGGSMTGAAGRNSSGATEMVEEDPAGADGPRSRSAARSARLGRDLPRIVLIAGTGSIVLGRGTGPRWFRAGGWGWLLGDEGGGQWLGRAALAAAAAAWDGGPPTGLASLARRHFHLRSPAGLADVVYTGGPGGGPLAPAQFAALAPGVFANARAGDPVSEAIVVRGMAALAAQAAAVLRRMRAAQPELGEPALFAAQGAIFRAGAVALDPLAAALRRECRLAGLGAERLVAPRLPPLGGAFLLALDLLGVAPRRDVLDRFAAALPAPAR